jgi:hypothetical protein
VVLSAKDRSAKYFAPNASLCLARLWSQLQITKVVCPLVKCHRLWQPFPCTPFRHCLQFRVVSNYTQVVLVSCFEWEGWKQSVKPQSGALIVLAKWPQRRSVNQDLQLFFSNLWGATCLYIFTNWPSRSYCAWTHCTDSARCAQSVIDAFTEYNHNRRSANSSNSNCCTT